METSGLPKVVQLAGTAGELWAPDFQTGALPAKPEALPRTFATHASFLLSVIHDRVIVIWLTKTLHVYKACCCL